MTLLSRVAGVLSLALILTGAGCSSKTSPATTGTNGATIQQGVRAFQTGDVLVYSEPAGVVDGKLLKEAVTRRVTLDAYTPAKSYDGSYELTKATDMSKVIATGTWKNVTLNTAHPFYLPGVIDAKYRPLGEASALILGREEIRELVNTSGTTIDPRFMQEPAWRERMGADQATKRGFDALLALNAEADKARKDTTFAKQMGPIVNRTILVNGKEEKIQAYQVRNWYGVYEILAREDAPVVLSFTLDPQVDKKRLDATKGDGLATASLVNFQLREFIYKDR